MVYLSGLIDDLAFVFYEIREIEARYMTYNIRVFTQILVTEKGFVIAYTPRNANPKKRTGEGEPRDF